MNVKKKYKYFLQYAAICKAILKEGPTLQTALEKCDSALEKMTEDVKLIDITTTNQKKDDKIDMEQVINQIEHNRAKIQHSKEECKKLIEKVQKAGRKISNANLW